MVKGQPRVACPVSVRAPDDSGGRAFVLGTQGKGERREGSVRESKWQTPSTDVPHVVRRRRGPSSATPTDVSFGQSTLTISL